MSSVSVLIAGHSQVKYFSKYISASNVDVLAYPGYQIHMMFDEIRDYVSKYDVVVLHVGANDLSRGVSVEKVLAEYQLLVESIWRVKPKAHVFISEVLPRGDNRFPGARETRDFISGINSQAAELNSILRYAAEQYTRLHFVSHPSFYVDSQVRRSQLSRDGLHLSFNGTKDLVEEIRRDVSIFIYMRLSTNTPRQAPAVPADQNAPADPKVSNVGQTPYRDALLRGILPSREEGRVHNQRETFRGTHSVISDSHCPTEQPKLSSSAAVSKGSKKRRRRRGNKRVIVGSDRPDQQPQLSATKDSDCSDQQVPAFCFLKTVPYTLRTLFCVCQELILIVDVEIPQSYVQMVFK